MPSDRDRTCPRTLALHPHLTFPKPTTNQPPFHPTTTTKNNSSQGNGGAPAGLRLPPAAPPRRGDPRGRLGRRGGGVAGEARLGRVQAPHQGARRGADRPPPVRLEAMAWGCVCVVRWVGSVGERGGAMLSLCVSPPPSHPPTMGPPSPSLPLDPPTANQTGCRCTCCGPGGSASPRC